MRLEERIRERITEEIARTGRSDLFRTPIVGFSSAADPRYGALTHIVGEWCRPPRAHLPGANSVISYFVPFTKALADAPQSGREGAALWAEAYRAINARFPVINAALTDLLVKEGFAAGGVSAAANFDALALRSGFSHRSAAVISGIAAFGANRMAITQKGSAGRFSSLFTTAQLSALPAAPLRLCPYEEDGSCGLCFAACPAGALTPHGFDRFACSRCLAENGETLRKEGQTAENTCGKCVGACPLRYIEG